MSKIILLRKIWKVDFDSFSMYLFVSIFKMPYKTFRNSLFSTKTYALETSPKNKSCSPEKNNFLNTISSGIKRSTYGRY